MDQVVAILEGRIHNQRGPEYRVRWSGSDGSDDEWFPSVAVEKDYPDLLLVSFHEEPTPNAKC